MDVLGWMEERICLLTREIMQKFLTENVKIEGKQSWEWKSLFGDMFDISG